jgi:hypothetical protein
MAALPSAFVNGSALATENNATAIAPARRAELTGNLVDMGESPI